MNKTIIILFFISTNLSGQVNLKEYNTLAKLEPLLKNYYGFIDSLRPFQDYVQSSYGDVQLPGKCLWFYDFDKDGIDELFFRIHSNYGLYTQAYLSNSNDSIQLHYILPQKLEWDNIIHLDDKNNILLLSRMNYSENKIDTTITLEYSSSFNDFIEVVQSCPLRKVDTIRITEVRDFGSKDILSQYDITEDAILDYYRDTVEIHPIIKEDFNSIKSMMFKYYINSTNLDRGGSISHSHPWQIELISKNYHYKSAQFYDTRLVLNRKVVMLKIYELIDKTVFKEPVHVETYKLNAKVRYGFYGIY